MFRTNLKVTHVVPALFRSHDGVVGGAERYALELARNMADVVSTSLVTFGENGSEETVGALKVRMIGNAHFVRGQRTNPVALPLVNEVLNADVVHCHQQHVVASSMAAATCRVTGRKVYVSDLGGGGWDISGYVSTDRWYHGHLHISEYSRSLSSPSVQARSHVILGGVDTERFSPDPGVPKGDGVLFVGRLLPHKGVNYLIEGLPEDMPLSIVGLPYDQKFFGQLQTLAAGKLVAFHQDCDDADLVQEYRKAMCIVLPSVYRDINGGETRVPELLGQTLLEGMACGLPAICTKVASMPEIVVDGVHGFVVPPNDPRALRDRLCWLRAHPGKARDMGQAARQRVLDKFSWPTVVERCLHIYQS